MSWEDELDDFARLRGPALVGYAYLLTGELHAAQDLVQDAFVTTAPRGANRGAPGARDAADPRPRCAPTGVWAPGRVARRS